LVGCCSPRPQLCLLSPWPEAQQQSARAFSGSTSAVHAHRLGRSVQRVVHTHVRQAGRNTQHASRHTISPLFSRGFFGFVFRCPGDARCVATSFSVKTVRRQDEGSNNWAAAGRRNMHAPIGARYRWCRAAGFSSGLLLLLLLPSASSCASAAEPAVPLSGSKEGVHFQARTGSRCTHLSYRLGQL
jgi:hypothetical protein